MAKRYSETSRFQTVSRWWYFRYRSDNECCKGDRARLCIPLGQVDVGLLADQVGVAATDTLDLGQGVHDLLLSINVGVEETQNVLEVGLLS